MEKRERKPRVKWTKEECYRAARECGSRSEFAKKYSKGYEAARKNGWLDELFPKKWTKEECYRAASEYKTRNEFKRNCGVGYQTARKNNWLDEYEWFEDGRKLASQKRTIWTKEKCYEEARKYKKRSEFKKNCDRGYQVARRKNWFRDYWWFEDGRKLASQKRTIWTKEKCYEEACKYGSRSEFQKNCRSGYKTALKNDWFGDYWWFEEKKKPNGYWTKERCCEEARKYGSRSEFEKKCTRGYQIACKNKWLDDYWWFERKQNPFTDKTDNVYCYYFTEFNSVYVGRTVNPQERDCCHRIRGTVYNFARKNKTEVPEMVLLETNLSLEKGLELEDYYVNKFKKEGWSVLNKAKTGKGSGALGALGRGKWTKEKCYEEARKCKTRSEFAKNCCSGYNVARKNGWLGDYYWFEEKCKHSGYWTKEKCYKEACKYGSRSEFQKNCCSAYNAARRNNWIEGYYWLKEIKKPNGYWTKERCCEEVLKYSSRNEFQKKCQSAYNAALRNKWLDELFPKNKKTA